MALRLASRRFSQGEGDQMKLANVVCGDREMGGNVSWFVAQEWTRDPIE